MIVATIIGVRPQFVKAAVLSPIMLKEHKEALIHTGLQACTVFGNPADKTNAFLFSQYGVKYNS